MQLFGKTKFKKITNFALNLKWKKFRKRTKLHFRIIWIERIPLLQVYFSDFIAKQGRIFKDICIKESTQFCSACSSSGLIYYGHVSSSFRRKRPRANYFIIIIYYEVFLYFFLNQFFQKIVIFAFWREKIRRHLVKGVLL